MKKKIYAKYQGTFYDHNGYSLTGKAYINEG